MKRSGWSYDVHVMGPDRRVLVVVTDAAAARRRRAAAAMARVYEAARRSG